MQWLHIQVKIKLFKPPWEEGLDKFLFSFKSFLYISKDWKTLFYSRESHILLQGVYQNEQGEAGI